MIALRPSAVRSGRIWAFVPAAMLVCVVAGLSAMAVIAVDDPNFAVEKDYYRKAVEWDGTQQQAGENQRLGFQLLLPATLQRRADGTVRLTVELKDQQGSLLASAALRAEAFANAHADRISSLILRETSPGRYEAEFSAHVSGLWEFRFDVKRGEQRFTAILRRDVNEGGPA